MFARRAEQVSCRLYPDNCMGRSRCGQRFGDFRRVRRSDLVIFALLKLFDLEGIKDGFAMYDLLAKRANAMADASQ